MAKFKKGDCVKMLPEYVYKPRERQVGKVTAVIGGDLVMVQYGGYGGRFQSYDASIFKKAVCPRRISETYPKGSGLRGRRK